MSSMLETISSILGILIDIGACVVVLLLVTEIRKLRNQVSDLEERLNKEDK